MRFCSTHPALGTSPTYLTTCIQVRPGLPRAGLGAPQQRGLTTCPSVTVVMKSWGPCQSLTPCKPHLGSWYRLPNLSSNSGWSAWQSCHHVRKGKPICTLLTPICSHPWHPPFPCYFWIVKGYAPGPLGVRINCQRKWPHCKKVDSVAIRSYCIMEIHRLSAVDTDN